MGILNDPVTVEPDTDEKTAIAPEKSPGSEIVPVKL